MIEINSFFFFQAEDGIRDPLVTGVQTCALPIFADLGVDQLIVYALDTAAGKLLPHAQTRTRPGAGPRHIAFHPDSQRVYLGNELDNTVNVYDYDAAGGTLRELQTLETLPAGAPESYVADVHVSAAGDRVY